MRKIEVDALSSLEGEGLVLVTQGGKVSGLYVPLQDPDQISDALRRGLILAVGRHLARDLEAKGIVDEEILKDFKDFRRHRH